VPSKPVPEEKSICFMPSPLKGMSASQKVMRSLAVCSTKSSRMGVRREEEGAREEEGREEE
jgi:hypothetical protein